MANSIRINSGNLKIEVNDDGEYIILPLGSEKFIQSFYKMMDDLRKKTETAANELKASDESPESILNELDQVVSVSDSLFEQTEQLFGEGTCRKVFGETRPGIIPMIEFFDALLPFIEDYQKERASRLNKYDAARTGSV